MLDASKVFFGMFISQKLDIPKTIAKTYWSAKSCFVIRGRLINSFITFN